MPVRPQAAKLKRVALDLLFPKWCVGCGKDGDFICSSCCQSLSHLTPPLCPLCGKPQPEGILCASCVNWQAEIDGIRSPFQFEGVIRKAIHQLKYQNIRSLTETLARLLSDYLTTSSIPKGILVPVPLHPKRLRERGYNQSGLLARELGKLANLDLVDDYLIRRQHTDPQTKVSTVRERRSNVACAFICRDHRLRNKQVLLIDDVAISGATLDACAAALKASGVTSVWGLTVAREV
jgi:ComF family protein